MMQFVLQVPDKTIKHKVFRKEIALIYNNFLQPETQVKQPFFVCFWQVLKMIGLKNEVIGFV